MPQQFKRSSIQKHTGQVNFNPAGLNFSSVYVWKIFDQNNNEISLISNPTANTIELNIAEKFFNYGLYRIVFNYSATIFATNEVQYSEIDTYVEVIPSGIIVAGLQNSVTDALIGKMQAYELNPRSYSYDLDGLIHINSLTFTFYCKLIERNLGNINYLSNPNINDLKTAKDLNTLSDGSCFTSASNLNLVYAYLINHL